MNSRMHFVDEGPPADPVPGVHPDELDVTREQQP